MTAMTGAGGRTLAAMCAGCAMAAIGSASGVRSWLQTRGWSWLTPERLRRGTIALFVVATLVPTVGLSGSTKPPAHQHPAPVVASR